MGQALASLYPILAAIVAVGAILAMNGLSINAKETADENTAVTTQETTVIVKLTGNAEASPAVVAKYTMEHGYYIKGSGTVWSLMTTGAAAYMIEQCRDCR